MLHKGPLKEVDGLREEHERPLEIREILLPLFTKNTTNNKVRHSWKNACRLLWAILEETRMEIIL